MKLVIIKERIFFLVLSLGVLVHCGCYRQQDWGEGRLFSLFADVEIKMGARFGMFSGKVIFVFANLDLCLEFGKVYGIHIIPKSVFFIAWFGVCV